MFSVTVGLGSLRKESSIFLAPGAGRFRVEVIFKYLTDGTEKQTLKGSSEIMH